MDDPRHPRSLLGHPHRVTPGGASAAVVAGAAHAAERNLLLRALPLEEYVRLRVWLTPTRLRLGDVLAEPGAAIRSVYFVREGVCSVLAIGLGGDREGGSIEVGTIGSEGFVGLSVLHGIAVAAYRVQVQIAGDAWELPVDAFEQLVEERPAVRRLLLRYAQGYTDQVAQTAACNGLHAVEARCARWLLLTHDRVEGDQFDLTHELLAQMLGVRRAGVSVAMGALQAAGVVRYTRGQITVLDRAGLEAAACGCYRVTRLALDRPAA